MPFAWTGIHLHSILHGASSAERERDKTAERDSAAPNDIALPSSGANSLGNYHSIVEFVILMMNMMDEFRSEEQHEQFWAVSTQDGSG